MLPTPYQFLTRLEASPADAAAFDQATRRELPHCKTRREAVEAVLNAVRATIAESAALKTKLAASKTKLAALEVAKLKNQRLKAELTLSKNRLEKLKSAPAKPNVLEIYSSLTGQAKRDFLRKNAVELQTFMKTIPLPTRAPTANITAAEFTEPPTMTRSEFQKLSPADRLRFSKQGGKLI